MSVDCSAAAQNISWSSRASSALNSRFVLLAIRCHSISFGFQLCLCLLSPCIEFLFIEPSSLPLHSAVIGIEASCLSIRDSGEQCLLWIELKISLFCCASAEKQFRCVMVCRKPGYSQELSGDCARNEI